jgi:hypothetical protein
MSIEVKPAIFGMRCTHHGTKTAVQHVTYTNGMQEAHCLECHDVFLSKHQLIACYEPRSPVLPVEPAEPVASVVEVPGGLESETPEPQPK